VSPYAPWRQTRLPSALLKASKQLVGLLQLMKMKLPSRSGEAAFCQAMTVRRKVRRVPLPEESAAGGA